MILILDWLNTLNSHQIALYTVRITPANYIQSEKKKKKKTGSSK